MPSPASLRLAYPHNQRQRSASMNWCPTLREQQPSQIPYLPMRLNQYERRESVPESRKRSQNSPNTHSTRPFCTPARCAERPIRGIGEIRNNSPVEQTNKKKDEAQDNQALGMTGGVSRRAASNGLGCTARDGAPAPCAHRASCNHPVRSLQLRHRYAVGNSSNGYRSWRAWICVATHGIPG